MTIITNTLNSPTAVWHDIKSNIVLWFVYCGENYFFFYFRVFDRTIYLFILVVQNPMKIVYTYDNGIRVSVINPKTACTSRNGIVYFVPGSWDQITITSFYHATDGSLAPMQRTYARKQAPIEGMLDRWGCPYVKWDGISIDPIYVGSGHPRAITSFGAISYPTEPRGNCGLRRYVTGLPTYGYSVIYQSTSSSSSSS